MENLKNIYEKYKEELQNIIFNPSVIFCSGNYIFEHINITFYDNYELDKNDENTIRLCKQIEKEIFHICGIKPRKSEYTNIIWYIEN